MSNPSRGKKSKPNRPGSKKSLGQNQNQPFDGAYGNPTLVHTLLSLMGKNCQTKVRNGGTYEGVFHTFNPKMDLALSAVHMSDNSDHAASTNGLDEKAIANGFPKEEELIHEMVFLTENLVSANFEDVDLNFAALDVNEANGELMSQQRSSAKAGEKKLEPWNGGGDTLGPDPLAIGGLESSGPEGTNGWDPAEMFKANKEKYGVVSNYDSSLSSYTMPLEIKATEEDSVRVARATKIAQEIEAGNDYKNRINLELDDGVSEEDKFSAVTRDRDPRRDGRGPRDMRDREGEYGSHRGDKDRGDRDHPSPPQGQYRGNKHSDFDQRLRNNRGRARDPWRNQQAYSNQNIPPTRAGPGVGQSGGGGGRNQPPMSQMDGPPGQGQQGKPYRGSGSGHLPPRFTKSGSGGHSRDEERMRQTSDNSPMHASYQAPKARPQRMPRSSGGRWPPTTSGEYAHHSPTQMHPDPAVISSGPAGGPLSRTSSSSSNTSAPVQNHRKALSTSSQEEQSQHSGPHHPHIRQPQSSSSPTGGPVIPNTHQAPPRLPGMHPGGPPSQPDVPGAPNSWASAVIRGNQKPHNMGAVAADMQQPHVGHISPSGLAQQPSGSNKIQFVSVPPNVTLSWTPSPASRYAQQGMAQPMPGGMNSPRVVHPNTPIQPQMMSRAHPQAQQSVMTSPPQPQAMPTQQLMQAQHQQQMSMPQRVAQPPVKTQSSAPPESAKQAEKSDDLKTKKPAGPSQAQPISIKSRNEGQSSIKELQEFRDSFKLSTNLNKDQSPMSNKTQQRHQPNVRQQQQPHPATSRSQPPYPNPAAQQQPYKHQAQQQHSGPYPGAMIHQDHGPPHSMAHPTDPSLVQQLKPHPQHVHHMPHPQIAQMPMASPGIQRFAGPQAPMHVSPMGLMDNSKIMSRTDKSAMQMQQRPLTSSKSDISNFNLNGNVHVVSGQPVLQTTPSAVISVSAAPHVTSQYPAAVTVNAQMGHQRMKQSPITVPVLSPSSTPSIEQVGSLTSTTTSPTAAKPLNPEATEFKPRTSAKPVAIATRAVTPLQHQGYVAASYQPQVIGGLGPQASQLLYNTGQVPQFDPMQASMPPMYPQFPQQIIFGQQQLVQQIPGQPQMQQFTTFDQNGQVYAGSAPQTMMAQNARMAALPATPQQHVAQYPLDQSPGTVYVPVSAQQANFMQQARPHSATPTPTQGSHVTAASPAGQPTQASQHATQPAPAMVQTPGAQQQMWMMVQAQHHQHVNQPPQLAHTQYINAMPTQMPSTVAMTNVTQQPKGQQQPMQYMGQPPPRQYAQYQSAAPNN